MTKSVLKPIVLVLSITTIFIAGCSAKNDKKQITETKVEYPPEVRENYLNYCEGCHGENLQKFQKSEWMFGDSDSSAFKSIKFGREDIGMPSFQKAFKDLEIQQLANYVRTQIPDESQLTEAVSPDEIIESKHQKFTYTTVIDGLEIPWGMEFLPNGDMLIAERSGKLLRLSNGKLTEIKGLPDIMVYGQGGLLDLRLHPNYSQNKWLYFSFSKPNEKDMSKGNTAIMRAKIRNNTLVDKELIFDGEPDTDKPQHFGCKLVFDKEGYLWFGIGDRGFREFNPQSLTNHCGKIHRIKDDGSIPNDNPFVNTPDAMPSIYSYGHRNPQGLDIHPVTGKVWETEHGPKGGDELNLIQAGKNYGWPVISYGINYDGTTFTDITHKEGMEQPITYWVPSIAPCGMTFNTSERYNGWSVDDIFIGSLSFRYLERVRLDGDKVIENEKLLENIGRVRNVRVSPDGFIYVAVESPGAILKLLPVNE